MSGFTAVGYYLFSLVFGIVIYSLWLRIALRYFKVSSLNPFSQLVYTVTNPIVGPINALFKLPAITQHKFDFVALGVLLVIEFIKIITYSLLVFHAIIPMSLIIIYVFADFIIQPCNLIFYAILIRVLMSFINPTWAHPLEDFLRVITQPLLKLGRKIVPDISGFDFSPYVIMVILIVITLFISASLPGRLI